MDWFVGVNGAWMVQMASWNNVDIAVIELSPWDKGFNLIQAYSDPDLLSICGLKMKLWSKGKAPSIIPVPQTLPVLSQWRETT